MSEISRRSILKAGALGAVTILGGAASSRAGAPASTPRAPLFFTAEEAAFIDAAVARLIPADEQWGGAREAGVANYVDLQLAGAWGAGERLYRSGPWVPGTASQGYQLPFTPAELFRKALGAINKELAATPFAKMSAAKQDAYLRHLETSSTDLGGVPSDVFFMHLWELTVEGFFSDPVYGGNRDMLGWRMVGFPGAYASYYELVDQHGVKFDRPPMSLAEDANRHVHMDPNIPAYLLTPSK